MKKVIYIGIIFFGLVASSCQKQEIVPNTVGDGDIPQWNRSGDNGRVIVTDGDGGGSGIVDPNGEDDGSDRPTKSGN